MDYSRLDGQDLGGVIFLQSTLKKISRKDLFLVLSNGEISFTANKQNDGTAL